MLINLAIVEDNPGDVTLIEALLAESTVDTFVIRVVSRVAELGALFTAETVPDILLVDLNLPDSRGFETIDQVRAQAPKTPIVAMTSNGQCDIARNAVAAGVQDFIIKGEFDAAHLARTLHFALTRHRSTIELFQQANYDALTGLANRYLFNDRLSHALDRASRHGEIVALLLVDIDDFRQINEQHGPEVGDRYLHAMAQIFMANVRNCDTVARLDSNRFAIIVENLAYPQAAIHFAKSLLSMSNKVIAIDNIELSASFSIGIAFHTPDSQTNQRCLMRGADNALERAKAEGKNDFRTSTEELDTDLVDRLDQDTQLQAALANNEFLLYCQPIVATDTKALIAYETLLRWKPTGQSVRQPGKFIPDLERLGLMRDVGEFVLRSAIAQHGEWLRQGMGEVAVSINVSASQLHDVSFSTLVRDLLIEHDVPAELVHIELTEELLINDTPITRQIFSELTAMGIRFSIDDFGTGHNSYTYLKKFPISTLKIDRSFTRFLHVDPIDRAIARSLVAMARELNMTVIAEGVENHIVLSELETLKPDGLQGYLIGRPTPTDRFEQRYLYAMEPFIPEQAAV